MAISIRHAVSRQTGSTTLAHNVDGKWQVDCLNHSTTINVKSRGAAWTTSSHPALFCPKCKSIAAGKSPRITEARLDIPTATKRARATAVKATAVKKPTPTGNKGAASKPATTTRTGLRLRRRRPPPPRLGPRRRPSDGTRGEDTSLGAA